MFVAQLGQSCRCWVRLKSLCSSAALHYFEFSSVLLIFFWFIFLFAFLFLCFPLNKSNNIFLKSDLTRVFYQLQKISMLNIHLYILQAYSSILNMYVCVFKSSLLKAWKNWPNFIKLRQRLNLLDPTKALQTSPNTYVAPNKHLCLSVALIGAGMSFKLSGLSKSPVFLTKAAIQTRQMDNCFRGPQMSRFTASAKVN